MEMGMLALIIGGVILLSLIIVGIVMTRLYKRATKEQSFVRTGLGGQKVVKDGGAIVVPTFHQIQHVNMETLRLEVRRNGPNALITQDYMRVDVLAEFYVRVKPDEASIAFAAQTLGNKTRNADMLREFVEGKFVDALRSVAAGMDMEQLHKNRADFVQSVQTALEADLVKNGLELESVSLTGLDQTPAEHFDENNAFDAEGLRKLAEITEAARKRRNDVERDTAVAIERKNLEATQQELELKKEREYATLQEEREVAIRKAEQQREIAEKSASETKASELARIAAERETQEAEIKKQQALEAEDIQKQQALEAAEIEKKKAIEAADIAKKKALELAEQERAIEVANKSKEQSEAQAAAEEARAKAVAAEEQVKTEQARAIAEREKEIAVINERADAEKEAAKILVAAEAEKTAAEDRAAAKLTEATADREAITIAANAEAEKTRVTASAEAERITALAEARAKEYETEAAGKEAINQAAEKLPQAERDLQYKLRLAELMPSIVAEVARPIGDIDSFRVVDMRGSSLESVKQTLGASNTVNITDGGLANNGATASTGNLPQQIVDSLMTYKVSMPLITQLTDELGIDLKEGLGGITTSLTDKTTKAGDETVTDGGADGETAA